MEEARESIRLGRTPGMVLFMAGLLTGLLLMLAPSPANAAPPANNNFGSAQAISGEPLSLNGTTLDATRQTNEPDHWESGYRATVWYSWTPGRSGAASVYACDENDYVGAVAVYSGAALDGLTELDSGYCAASLPVTAGSTYKIAIASDTSWDGPFTLEIDVFDPPENDGFSAATEITGTTVAGTTRGASLEAAEPEHAEGGGDTSVWYSWTPAESGTASLNACNNEDDYVAGIAVYTGSALDSLTKVDDGYCRTTFAATEGTTYRIAIVGYSSYAGAFDLSARIVHAPPNDDFASAATIDSNPVSGTTEGATIQTGEPDHSENETTASVWYSWTPSQSGTAIVNACSDDYAIDAIAIYTGDDVAGLTELASGYCRTNFQASAGATYRIALGSYTGSWGEFTLDFRVVAPPANDNFSSFTQITSVATPLTGTTEGATVETGEPDHYDYGADATVWYRLAYTTTATRRLSTCDDENGVVSAMAVYEGSSFDNLVLRGSGDCEVLAEFKAGVQYRIAVSSYSEYWGEFNISFARILPPVNDAFESPIQLTGNWDEYEGHTFSATHEAGESAHRGGTGDGSGWFSWTAPRAGTVTFDLCAEFDGVVAAYAGGSLAALAPVSQLPDGDTCDSEFSASRFHATAGTTYRVAVDGETGDDLGFYSLYMDFDADPDPVQRYLDVGLSGAGSGKVTSTPAGVDCSSDCSVAFTDGTVLTLQAVPQQGSTFAGWVGDCSGTGTCQVTMNQTRGVTAEFIPIPPPKTTLTVAIQGSGSGTVSSSPAGINCGADCQEDFDPSAIVLLTPTPAPGSVFAGWAGTCASSVSSCYIGMATNAQTTARFEKEAVLPDIADLTLEVETKSLKVKAGAGGNVKLTLSSIGGLPAEDVKLCLMVPKKHLKFVKPPKCQTFKSRKPRSSIFTGLRFRTTKKSRGKVRMKVSVTSANAQAESANVTLTIKPKPKGR